MKSESLVIVDQHATVNSFSGLVHTARHTMGVGFTLGSVLRLLTLGTPSFHCLTGGVYKARERIHRIIADMRLLANPAS